MHFHLGQFPTTEYQMMGRDRDWKGKALDEMVAWFPVIAVGIILLGVTIGGMFNIFILAENYHWNIHTFKKTW